MDRRGWPWKKKSSDKGAAEKAAAGAASESSGTQGDQDSYKKPNYVQISVESYSHLTGLEDQVKTCEEQIQTLEDQIKELNEKLEECNSEMTTKENLVKQHAKVAEEAVSGWEKAEAEALALKNHLETVTLSKLTAEDRAAHLDAALKECMRQIRNLKEEHEQKLQDVTFSKTKQCEKIKLELEAKIANLDQELLRSAAENFAISRSLQERSNMLIKISEEKSQAEADIELLKGNIESCEREINSLKYELHIVSKELEIRNEEKNMCMKSADAANKQHTEGVKKITKLEAECQRLRGLVRKKLPGPAALAQMKLEVENFGCDYGESRLRRSPVKPPSPHLSPVTEFSLDNLHKFQKENEFLTERLFAMEEETKMLKEALAKRNSELQASRSMCAKTASKLQCLETQVQNGSLQRNSLKSIVQFTVEGLSTQNSSIPPSLASMSEDGNDDMGSCAESWASALVSELSQFKDKKNEKSKKSENAKHLELMDDFLEMEKLACSTNDSNGATSIPDSSNNRESEIVNHDASEGGSTGKDIQSEQQSDSSPSTNVTSFNVELSELKPSTDADDLPLIKLRSKISLILESVSKDSDTLKILEDIKRVVLDTHDALRQHSVNCLSCASEEVRCSDVTCDRQANPDDAGLTTEKQIALSQPAPISQDLEAAIYQIHDFVLFLGKEAIGFHDLSPEGSGLSKKLEKFSATFNNVVIANTNLVDFVLDLSHVLSKSTELRFSVLDCKGTDGETNSPDCIDKVALPENKEVQTDLSEERYQNGCSHISNPPSGLEVPDDGNLVLGYESNSRPSKISLEEFEELKSEKQHLEMEFARCTEDLEGTKCKLRETDQLLAEVKSQLAFAQKSNSLSETQLKCMAESYRLLERRAEELETELNLLRAKTQSLENELQDEKSHHLDALARCKELQEQLQRHDGICSVCSSAMENAKDNQERELAAAAEKLAECQETIFLLSKQLKSFRPQSELGGSPYIDRSDRSQRAESFTEDEPSKSSINLQDLEQTEMDTAASPSVHRVGAESPSDMYNSPYSPSDNEGNLLRSPIRSKNPKHRPTKSSSSSSSSSGPTPEKQARGFSRFFSSKGKNSH